MRQTSLVAEKDTTAAPYNGLFFCYIRRDVFRWNEFINFYKAKRL